MKGTDFRYTTASMPTDDATCGSCRQPFRQGAVIALNEETDEMHHIDCITSVVARLMLAQIGPWVRRRGEHDDEEVDIWIEVLAEATAALETGVIE